MITITMNQIKSHDPCEDGWEKIVAATHLHGGDFDKPFPLAALLDTNGLEDTLWALRCLPEHDRLWRKYAVWCARQVQHLMTDQRSIDALDVAERYADGLVDYYELPASRSSAWDALDQAGGAKCCAIWVTASRSSWAAYSTSRDAALLAEAHDEARASQAIKLRQIMDSGKWVEGDA